MIILQIVFIAIAAIAAVSGQCMIGNEVQPTEAITTNGQYVNLNNPATCSGNLTAWHFCYYRSSIDTGSSMYSIYLRVWRNVQGNTYNLISNAEVRGSPNLNAGDVICIDALIAEDQYVQVEQGDVIAVYMPFTIPTVSILASAVVQELHQDMRGSVAFSATQFNRNDLRIVNTYGLHLQADISSGTTTPSIPTTMSTITTESTTVMVTTTVQPITMTTTTMATMTIGATTVQPTTMGPTSPDSQSTTSDIETEFVPEGTVAPVADNSDNHDNSGTVAAVVIVVLLLVLGVAIGITLFLVCYLKRKHGSFKGCLQRSRTSFLAIDNLIYRVGSNRIPVQVPKKNSRPTSNANSQQYDIPKDRHNRTLYDIPHNNTPSIHESQNYSVVRPFSQSISTVQSVNGGHNTEAHNGHVVDTLLRSTATGDYIFMDSNEQLEGPVKEKDMQSEGVHSGSHDDEAYIYLTYGTVEYHKLLSQATDGDNEVEGPFHSPPSNEEEIYVVLSEQHIKVIPRKAIQIEQRLGSGHFGNVNKGTWNGSKGTLQVAVKSLNKNASQNDKVRLLQEAAIMGQFKHPNITHLHGIVTQGEPLLLLMEYMPKGDLKQYLGKLRPASNNLIAASVPYLLVSFSQQVALGMHYLASKGFVHRDLAARNVFVSAEDTCRIGDFGMSRDLSENGCYTGRGGKVPLKWMAPEAIHRRKYSIASDVWSYGCVLFEIWSLGRKPFRGIETKKTLNLIDTGYRLPPPPGCPFIIYDLMIKCWHPVAGSRPKYRDILTSLLQEETKVLDVPVEDASTHPEACLLGASIEAGTGMYLGLQQCYNPDASDKNDPDYEYGETD